MQVQHILVKALVARPPRSIFRLKRWMEKLFEGVKVLSSDVFQLSETAFVAYTVGAQTHCAVHVAGDEFQMDLFTPNPINHDDIIKRLGDFDVGDHEILLVDRSGEFKTLVSCISGWLNLPDDPNDDNEY